ncbi:hypothetical protein BRO06_18225, partial [Xanthomonas oryzae pv. oryzae]
SVAWMPPHSEQIVSRICGALFRGSLELRQDLRCVAFALLSSEGSIVYAVSRLRAPLSRRLKVTSFPQPENWLLKST